MTALDLDRLEALAMAESATPGNWTRAYLHESTPYMTPYAAAIDLVAEVRRLAAESESRRLVLVLKATELRQAEAEVERLRQAHWGGRAIGGFDNDGDPTPRALVSDFAALILSDWRDAREAADEYLAEAGRAEEALRAAGSEEYRQALRADYVRACDVLATIRRALVDADGRSL